MLVSALMATFNRRQFVPRAIRCFLDQSYQDKELVIVDDGASVEDLVPDDERVRYVHLDFRWPLGTKMAWLADQARGNVFVIWDDDDWHGPERIARQVAALAEADVCLLEGFAAQYTKSESTLGTRRWNWRRYKVVADGTAAYTRDFYRSGRAYQNVTHPGQQLLIDRPRSRTSWLDGRDLYIEAVHRDNCATTHLLGAGWDEVDDEFASLTRRRLGGVAR